MPGTCKYQKFWEKDYYPWVSSVRTDPESAYCGIYLKSFKINNRGVGQLKSIQSATRVARGRGLL